MIDYAAEWCEAYEAAIGALAGGGDALAAAERTQYVAGGLPWSRAGIARAAAAAAQRDFRPAIREAAE